MIAVFIGTLKQTVEISNGFGGFPLTGGGGGGCMFIPLVSNILRGQR